MRIRVVAGDSIAGWNAVSGRTDRSFGRRRAGDRDEWQREERGALSDAVAGGFEDPFGVADRDFPFGDEFDGGRVRVGTDFPHARRAFDALGEAGLVG